MMGMPPSMPPGMDAGGFPSDMGMMNPGMMNPGGMPPDLGMGLSPGMPPMDPNMQPPGLPPGMMPAEMGAQMTPEMLGLGQGSGAPPGLFQELTGQPLDDAEMQQRLSGLPRQ
jgi:hypothetical protein